MKKQEIMPPEHCASVKDYEKSAWWRREREDILDDKGCVCEICGRNRWAWQTRKKSWKRVLRFAVHHITYEHCPHEKREDFMVLCSNCHSTCHDLLRYKNLGNMYQKLASIVSEHFFYKGIDTFKEW